MPLKKLIFSFICLFSLLLQSSVLQAKTYWKRGALIGGSVAAVASLPLTYSLCELGEESQNISSCRATAMPLGALTSGLVGFGIGAGIGALFKKKPVIPYVRIDPNGQNYHFGAQMNF